MCVARLLMPLVLAGALICSACSDDGDLIGGGTSFAPDPRTPAAAQVYLDFLGSSNEQVRVAVRVREVADLAAAELIVQFDPAAVLYRGSDPGVLFESAGPAVSYNVVESIAGRLEVDVRRPDGVSVSAGSGDPALIVLRLQANRTGLSRVDFNAVSRLVDGTGTSVPGVAFFGGELAR